MEMLRKSPTSNASAAIFTNADFLRAPLKLQNWVNFSFFSYLKLFSVSIIKKMTFVVSVAPS